MYKQINTLVAAGVLWSSQRKDIQAESIVTLTFTEKTFFLTSSQKENMKMASKKSFLKNHCVLTSIERYVFYENGSLYRKA